MREIQILLANDIFVPLIQKSPNLKFTLDILNKIRETNQIAAFVLRSTLDYLRLKLELESYTLEDLDQFIQGILSEHKIKLLDDNDGLVILSLVSNVQHIDLKQFKQAKLDAFLTHYPNNYRASNCSHVLLVTGFFNYYDRYSLNCNLSQTPAIADYDDVNLVRGFFEGDPEVISFQPEGAVRLNDSNDSSEDAEINIELPLNSVETNYITDDLERTQSRAKRYRARLRRLQFPYSTGAVELSTELNNLNSIFLVIGAFPLFEKLQSLLLNAPDLTESISTIETVLEVVEMRVNQAIIDLVSQLLPIGDRLTLHPIVQNELYPDLANSYVRKALLNIQNFEVNPRATGNQANYNTELSLILPQLFESNFLSTLINSNSSWIGVNLSSNPNSTQNYAYGLVLSAPILQTLSSTPNYLLNQFNFELPTHSQNYQFQTYQVSQSNPELASGASDNSNEQNSRYSSDFGNSDEDIQISDDIELELRNFDLDSDFYFVENHLDSNTSEDHPVDSLNSESDVTHLEPNVSSPETLINLNDDPAITPDSTILEIVPILPDADTENDLPQLENPHSIDEDGLERNQIFEVGDGTFIITNFGGTGRGASPSDAIAHEADSILFLNADRRIEMMVLEQANSDLMITFEDYEATQVILKNFALEDLDNLTIATGGTRNIGNLLFAANETQDSFDVINADQQLRQVFRRNTVTFLNELDNNTRGFDHSNDVINGQGGDDFLSGLSGDDTLRGSEGNDFLLGGLGRDRLLGGNGDDTLNGGSGSDEFYGGEGRDRFVLNPASGLDVIHDFRSGEDLLVLENGLSVGQLSFNQQGSHTLISINHQTQFVLRNVEATLLINSNHIFLTESNF